MGTATTTSSTNSGQGSEPLSDPFIAVAVAGVSEPVPGLRVEAPKGAGQLLIRRSQRVASSRSRSRPTGQASASNVSATEFVDAPPGGKRKVGYAYQVLDPVSEEAGPTGNADSLRDITTPQLGSASGAGRKRSATSAASGSGRHGPSSKRLASAADFSPTHFDEPLSDAPMPERPSTHRPDLPSPQLPSPHQPSDFLQRPPPHQPANFPSSMTFRQEVPTHGGSQRVGTPFSSPISQNPLLRRETPVPVQTPSPSRRRPPPFRTQDSNTAWAAAEGLLPIREGFTAPGYAPAHIVGGISYTVRSPHAHSPQTHQPVAQQASVGRQLFAEYAGNQSNVPQQLPAAKGPDLQQQLASQVPHFKQQTISQDVRLRTHYFHCAYI